MKSQKPRIFEFQDILSYLKAVYKFRKRSSVGFSYQSWSEEMGLRSRSYLRELVMGSKPLQESLLGVLLKGLDLDADESSYFGLLLRHHTATDEKVRGMFARELLVTWNMKLKETDVGGLPEFISDPLVPTLFTYLSFDEISPDLSLIAKDLNCDMDRVRKALHVLVWHRLVEGSVLGNGKISYKTITPFFKVPSSPANENLKRFHIAGIQAAREAADLPSEQRKMFSCFVALDQEQFATAQAMIADFNSRLLGLLGSGGLGGKKIYRLNQQLFAVSEEVDADNRRAAASTVATQPLAD